LKATECVELARLESQDAVLALGSSPTGRQLVNLAMSKIAASRGKIALQEREKGAVDIVGLSARYEGHGRAASYLS
jgi:hypothetical protein